MTNKEAKEYYKEYLKTDEAKAKMRETALKWQTEPFIQAGNPALALEEALKPPFEIGDFVKPKGTNITNAIGQNPGLVIVDIINLNKSLEFNFKCKLVGSARHDWYWGKNLEAITGTELETLLDEMKMTLGNLNALTSESLGNEFRRNPSSFLRHPFLIGDLVVKTHPAANQPIKTLKVASCYLETDGRFTVGCSDGTDLNKNYRTETLELIQAVDSPFKIGDRVRFIGNLKHLPVGTIAKVYRTGVELIDGTLVKNEVIEKCPEPLTPDESLYIHNRKNDKRPCRDDGYWASLLRKDEEYKDFLASQENRWKVGDNVCVIDHSKTSRPRAILTVIEVSGTTVVCVPNAMIKHPENAWKIIKFHNELEAPKTTTRLTEINPDLINPVTTYEIESDSRLEWERNLEPKISNLLDIPDELIDLKDVEFNSDLYARKNDAYYAEIESEIRQEIEEVSRIKTSSFMADESEVEDLKSLREQEALYK